MATPTITPLPTAPSRQNSAGTFATLADIFMGALPPFADQMNVAVDYIDDCVESAAASAQLASTNGATQVEAATLKANAATQSAQTAATQAGVAKTQADNSKAFRDSAQSAAAAAQAAAGLPAIVGKGGLPLVPKRDGSGVEYSSSLRKYDLDINSATEVLDLSTVQAFTIDASVPRTISFTNLPGAGRFMPVSLDIIGGAKITWPAGMRWNNNQEPAQGANWTLVILIWVGTGWVGNVGARG